MNHNKRERSRGESEVGDAWRGWGGGGERKGEGRRRGEWQRCGRVRGKGKVEQWLLKTTFMPSTTVQMSDFCGPSWPQTHVHRVQSTMTLENECRGNAYAWEKHTCRAAPRCWVPEMGKSTENHTPWMSCQTIKTLIYR